MTGRERTRAVSRTSSEGGRNRSAFFAAFFAAGVAAFVAAPAHAHVGLAEGRVPYADAEGAFVGGATTWGIVERTDVGFLRVCEEALGGPPAFYLPQPARGRVLIGRVDGLHSTEDGGCTLTPLQAGFEDAYPSNVAVAYDTPSTFYVATSSPIGTNSLRRTEDGGDTFTPTALGALVARFSTLRISDDGATVWTTTFTAEGVFTLHGSHDGGATFVEAAADLSSATFVGVVGVDNATREALVAVVPADAAGSVLARVSADGATFVEVEEFEGLVTDWLSFADRQLLILDRAQLRVRAVTDDSFFVQETPARCLARVPGATGVYACAVQGDGGHFFHSEDGVTWTSVLRFDEIEERECAEGTIGATACAFRTTDGGPASDGGDELDRGRLRPEPEAPPAPCACTEAGRPSSPGVALLVVMLLFVRRRRR